MNIPTDLQILEVIYSTYRKTFESYKKDTPNRLSKIYVPIDTELIANKLKVDPDIVFGRLYYHFEKKYGYEKEGVSVHFFSLSLGSGDKSERHVIHFPYMVSVLANLKYENRKFKKTSRIAYGSLFLGVISLFISVFLNWAAIISIF